MLDLYNEFRQLIAAIDKQQIDYALCGGLAMAVYDRPRATVDIDLLIRSESLDRVMAIATALGYTSRGLEMTFSSGAIERRRVSKIDSETGYVLSLDLLLGHQTFGRCGIRGYKLIGRVDNCLLFRGMV